MATDKSQNMDAFGRQELGWVVPGGARPRRTTVKDGPTPRRTPAPSPGRRRDGTPYTLTDGADGIVRNSEMYVAKLPGRQLLDPARSTAATRATPDPRLVVRLGQRLRLRRRAAGHNLDIAIPQLADLPAGSTVTLSFKSLWDIEWDYDYGFVLTTTDGGETYTSHASESGYTTQHRPARPATPTRTPARRPTATASPAPAAPTTPAPRRSTASSAPTPSRSSSPTPTTSATWPGAARRAAVQLRHRPGPGPARLVHRRRQGHRRPSPASSRTTCS